MGNKRRSPRHAFAGEVVFVSPQGVVGRGVDLASGGLGVVVPTAMETGTVVLLQVLDGRVLIHGTVRWCRAEDEAFRVGVQFEEEDWRILEHVDALAAGRSREDDPAR